MTMAEQDTRAAGRFLPDKTENKNVPNTVNGFLIAIFTFLVLLLQGVIDDLRKIVKHIYSKSQEYRAGIMKEETTLQKPVTMKYKQATKTKKKLSYLLIGKTGEGKSATGNSILGRKEFKASSRTTSVTQGVSNGFVEYGEYLIKVVDGPGLADTEMTKLQDAERAVDSMSDAIFRCDGRIDAFLLVVKFGQRLTSEDRETFEALKQLFGDAYNHYVIVVMTQGDCYKEHISFERWCKQQTGEFKKLFRDFNERFVLFNNRETDENKKCQQIEKIIQLTEEIQEYKGTYSSRTFQLAKSQRDAMIIELRAPILREEVQVKVNLLTAEIERFAENPLSGQKESIITKVQALKAEIRNVDQDYNLLGDLIRMADQVMQYLDNREELMKIAQNMEVVRKDKRTWGALGIIYTVGGGIIAVGCPPVGAVYCAAGAICSIRWGVKKQTENTLTARQNELTRRQKE